MGLFKPDLYRNFVIGFALGAAAIVVSAAPQGEAEFAGQAQAATTDSDPEFVDRAQ